MKRAILLSALALATSGAIAQSVETITQQYPAATAPVVGVGEVWRSPTALLYSNGALQTAATGGGAGGTEPVSVVTAPDTSFGATCAGATFRLSDDFVVPAGGWTLNKVTVFAYQTQAAPGGSTVSTLTGGTLQIWNGAPNVAGSTVVFGDATTNRVTASSFSTVWRVSSTTLTNVLRPVMAADFGGLNVTLPAGTYFIDYGLTGSTASGPFCPPNNVTSAANNALQFNVATATWAAVTDGGSTRPLDVPFVLDGVAGGGVPVAVTPSGTPLNFTIGSGGNATRILSFTGAGTVSCTATGPFTVTPNPLTSPGSVTVTATGAGSGVLTCVSGATTVATYPLGATVLVAAPLLNLWGGLALLLGLGVFGAFAVRRFS